MGTPTRPKRTDVTAAYDRGVEGYAAVWSPVLLQPAEAVVRALGLGANARVLDVGAGTGALVPTVGSEAPRARVIALDASLEMLRAVPAEVGAVQGDALSLPIADGAVDAVLLAYVLFHLNDPERALVEAARVLRTGGRLGTVTWAQEHGSTAHKLWDDALADAGVPAPPLRRNDTGLDSPDGMEALLRGAGLRPERAWLERLEHRWDARSFYALATGSGVNRVRLEGVEESTRRALLDQVRESLEALDPDDFLWWGEVVCAVATKAPSR